MVKEDILTHRLLEITSQAKTHIESLDIVILKTQKSDEDPAQYKIVQIQEKFDARPPAIYLSLEKVVQVYKDRRAENE